MDECTPLTGGRSTHTFCLYLATCQAGGETVLVVGFILMDTLNPKS